MRLYKYQLQPSKKCLARQLATPFKALVFEALPFKADLPFILIRAIYYFNLKEKISRKILCFLKLKDDLNDYVAKKQI